MLFDTAVLYIPWKGELRCRDELTLQFRNRDVLARSLQPFSCSTLPGCPRLSCSMDRSLLIITTNSIRAEGYYSWLHLPIHSLTLLQSKPQRGDVTGAEGLPLPHLY